MKTRIAVVLLCAAPSIFADMQGEGEQAAPVGEAAGASAQEASTIRWKANLFAGTALLAVVAGIVAIFVDGGTSTTTH